MRVWGAGLWDGFPTPGGGCTPCSFEYGLHHTRRSMSRLVEFQKLLPVSPRFIHGSNVFKINVLYYSYFFKSGVTIARRVCVHWPAPPFSNMVCVGRPELRKCQTEVSGPIDFRSRPCPDKTRNSRGGFGAGWVACTGGICHSGVSPGGDRFCTGHGCTQVHCVWVRNIQNTVFCFVVSKDKWLITRATTWPICRFERRPDCVARLFW